MQYMNQKQGRNKYTQAYITKNKINLKNKYTN